MSYIRQVPRALDDEHRTSLEFLGRLERVIRDRDSAATLALAGSLVRYLEHEVERHFLFEERELFPRLAEAGDEELAMLLAEEHETIRSVADELLPLAAQLAAGMTGVAAHPAFGRLALELVERQVAHIQKESMALLPVLEDVLDDDSDRELAFAYAGD